MRWDYVTFDPVKSKFHLFGKSRQKNVDMRTKRFIKAEKKQPGDTRRTRERKGLNNKEEDRNRKWKQEERNETGRLVSAPLCCRNKQSKSSNCFCLFHEYKPCAELQLEPPGLQIQELLDLKYFPAAITDSQRREKHMDVCSGTGLTCWDPSG